MFKTSTANFFKTSDNEQLFFVKNFTTIDPNKPVLVFNYGLVCSSLHWQAQTEYFDELGFQILTHDYRGHFQSTGAQDIKKLTFQQMAQDISDLCGYVGIERAWMLGHSMGVNICLQLAKDFPLLVKGMILISGTFMPVKDVMFDSNLMEFIAPVAQAGLEKYPEVFNKIWSTGGQNPLIRQIVHFTGFNRHKVSKEFIEVYLNRVGQLGAEVFFQLFNEMTRQNITGSLENMKVPALIIGGHHDNVIPNHLQRTLASLLPMSETYFLVEGSHVPQADYPELINERIELFVTQGTLQQGSDFIP
ncbi:MAG TPA: alpha/beta hydrolase [Bacteriovoracaceae bacterium]|nr:alpha/beta hydrolase [Bacteriovoracaceae bacterium]